MKERVRIAKGDDDQLPLSVADIARSKGRLHLTIRFGLTLTTTEPRE